MSRDVEDLNRRLLRARDAMDHAYAEPLDVRAVAAVGHISPAHVSRRFRAGSARRRGHGGAAGRRPDAIEQFWRSRGGVRLLG